MSAGARAGSGAMRHKLSERGEDLYETPPEATMALLGLEADYMPTAIAEPACGRGAISEILSECGFSVDSSDLISRDYNKMRVADFLSDDYKEKWHTKKHEVGCITNPPYKHADAFVKKAIDIFDYTAMFLRLGFLEGLGRKKWLYDIRPPSRIYISSRRMPMMHRDGWAGKRSSSTTCFCWYVWDHHAPEPPHWFDWKDFVD